nr:uncharacterized protein LOC111508466 [Leptinotarsa decemlineata]
MIFHLFWTGLCSIFGYSAFIAFLLLKNYPSAVLGLLSGTTDAVTFFIIFLKRRKILHLWYNRDDLRKICRLAIVSATLGLLNLGYHITIQAFYKTPMLPPASSEVISIVWSFILMRSGIVLMYYAIVYQKSEDVGLLQDHNEGHEEETRDDTIISVPSTS